MRRLMLLLLLSTHAHAADTWAIARNSGDERIVVQLGQGEVFPVAERAIDANRLQSALLLTDTAKQAIELEPDRPQPNHLPLNAAAQDAGWALTAITLDAETLTRDAEQVQRLLEKLDEPANLRTAWEASEQWRERRQSHAKALLRVGPTSAADLPMDAGMTMEFIPLNDPTRLRPGQPFDFRLELNDQPLAMHRVGIVYANSHGEVWGQTDADGRGRFVLAHPGWVMLRSVHIAASEAPDLDWESHATSLVFELPHAEIATDEDRW